MSANFCDENPDQSINNAHCFHQISRRAFPWKKGEIKTRKVFVITSQCCWCGDKVQENIIDPSLHGKKVRVMR